MSAAVLASIAAGAALGAWTRWGLAGLLNARLPALPLGTLAANVIGGFLIGIAMELFSRHGGVSETLRLFVVTGFLGGLTTFSTFSAEVVATLMRGQYGSALLIGSTHLAGSLLATVLGIHCVRWFGAG